MKIQQAIELRKQGRLKESLELCLQLVQADPTSAFIQYQTAWAYDALGEETKAVPYYEKAIDLGLTDEDLAGALLGLGSTFRCIGEYQKSIEILEKGYRLFPEQRQFAVFLSMAYFNVGQHEKSMELLLQIVSETSSDPHIQSYQRAIQFYSSRLHETWRD